MRGYKELLTTHKTRWARTNTVYKVGGIIGVIMSDTNEPKETAVVENTQSVELPPQQSATDTTNWDTKVSSGPSGETYIRTLPNVD